MDEVLILMTLCSTSVLAHMPPGFFPHGLGASTLGSFAGGMYRKANESTECEKCKAKVFKSYNPSLISHKMLQNVLDVCFVRIKQLGFFL